MLTYLYTYVKFAKQYVCTMYLCLLHIEHLTA